VVPADIHGKMMGKSENPWEFHGKIPWGKSTDLGVAF
jgi:hypothetical protein